jgi:MFS family permease
MDGIGAFVGALMIALWLTPRWYGRAYLGGVVCYLIMVVIFALVQSPALAGAALLLTGLGGAGFATMQATLVYLASPPEMRSRILGVLTVCIGTGPIGFLWLGWLADHIGSHNATGRDRCSRLAGDGRDLALVEGDLRATLDCDAACRAAPRWHGW